MDNLESFFIKYNLIELDTKVKFKIINLDDGKERAKILKMMEIL